MVAFTGMIGEHMKRSVFCVCFRLIQAVQRHDFLATQRNHSPPSRQLYYTVCVDIYVAAGEAV